GCRARISRTAWTPPPVFATLQHAGRVDETEMFRAFNMGIGYVIVLPPKDVDRATDALRAAGETVLRLGEIVAGERGVELAAGRPGRHRLASASSPRAAARTSGPSWRRARALASPPG